VRTAARALAGGLAREIRVREEAHGYRERLRLRGLEDEVTSRFAHSGGLDANLGEGVRDLRHMLDADGLAVLRGGELHLDGVRPAETMVLELARWVLQRGLEPVVTDRLSEEYPAAEAYQAQASGLLGLVVSADEPFVILWFRAEEMEVINWAGNPHKTMGAGPGETLTPRSSFAAWSETVRGRSRRWTLAEADAAARLRDSLLEARNHRRLHDLNVRLTEAVSEKDGLIQQKEMLLKEVNHRIQNSLQLVSSFLGLQSRASSDPTLQTAFEEARRRLSAVALVHRRLYRADQIESVDMARYLEDLIGDMNDSMGKEWAGKITVHASPLLVPTDRAVTLGLVITELVINANKYAYAGAPGPIEVSLEAHRANLRVIVADRGAGKSSLAEGFGSRMMNAMVKQLSGTIAYDDNKPGLRAILTAPVSAPIQPVI
jgi:light-regulated signal transduction histidine kinase (bacteriophytochrome)